MQRGGFSILELVIALALFLLVLTMLGAYASFSLVNLARGQSFIEAEALNQEGRSLVELVARRDWVSLNTSLNALHYDLGQWNLVSGVAEQIGVYQRQFILSPVCRDMMQAVVDCSLGSLDANSYRLTMKINWLGDSGNQEVSQETYITNW